MKLSFHGADRTVTGSCHLVECAGVRVLVDCGMYQGGRELDEENAGPFGFEASAIDFVLLTHAHLDHCGRLPLLARRGFRGEIVTTAATRELTRVVLLDAAHLQEEEARRRERKGGQGRSGGPPLYTLLNALNTLDAFGRKAEYGKRLELAPGIGVTFVDAGHILGSASLYLEMEEGNRTSTIAFSGDLGNVGRPILRDPVPPPRSDVIVMESTYGDRRHRGYQESVEELYAAIEEALGRGGNVVIPTFALERAQEILYVLREAVESGRLPRSLPVYLDSPMAISATEIFRRHPECYDADAAELFRNDRDPFALPGLHFTRETSESKALNGVDGAVIMAGSGMCTGGRVRHHLRHNLSRPDSSVVFVGYAARGTTARQIIDGAKSVRLFGEEVAVRARIHTINGFSAHADADELVAWHERVRPKRTFLVHGEEESMRALGARLKGAEVIQPDAGTAFDL